MLDVIFFSGFHSQVVSSPIYIIAPPRSGTTFLHRLMCLDEDRFTHLKTYQTILPCVSIYRLLDLVSPSGCESALAGMLNNRVLNRVFANWRDIHPIDMTQPEEDEAFFIYTLHSPAFYMLFPYVAAFPQLQFLDFLPQNRRSIVMSFYRRCLKRHLYASGSNRTLLSKNVFSAGRIWSLLETFPDARFIFIVRDPCEAIPSLISLFHSIWRAHSPETPKISKETKALAQMGLEYYRHVCRACESLPKDRFLCVEYEDLMKDPDGVVGRVYARFNLPLTDTFRLRLRNMLEENEEHQSSHSYSLEEYGLSRDDIHAELHEIMEILSSYTVKDVSQETECAESTIGDCI